MEREGEGRERNGERRGSILCINKEGIHQKQREKQNNHPCYTWDFSLPPLLLSTILLIIINKIINLIINKVIID